MKPTYGIGVLVVALLTAAVALIGVLSLQGAVSVGLLLAGLWTILAAFVVVGGRDRIYYTGWGIIISGLSLSYYIPIQDALAIILVAIVGLIVATAYLARGRAPVAAPTAGGTTSKSS